MKKLIKLIIYWLFPVSFVLMLTFSINILITDFRFAHQSHMVYQHPYSWSKYFIVLSFFDLLGPPFLTISKIAQWKNLKLRPRPKFWQTVSKIFGFFRNFGEKHLKI